MSTVPVDSLSPSTWRLWELGVQLTGKRTLVLRACALVTVVAGGWWVARIGWRTSGSTVGGEPLVLHTVGVADVIVDITERGSLVSQDETRIVCELETVYGQSGSRIVQLVPNGKRVKQGDLLIEFDSAPHRERVDNQTIVVENVNATEIQATAHYDNQKTENETALAAARLGISLAELNLKMYEDGEGGTYRIALREMNLRIQEARNQIEQSRAALSMQRTERDGIEMLFKLGYRGKGDLDQARYEYIQSEDAMTRAANSLATAVANRQKLEQYEHPMRLLELQGSLETAHRVLKRTERNNESYLAQALAAKTAAQRNLAKEQEKLDKYKQQLAKCRMLAPHDGMVAHSTERTPWGRVVGEGELVVERFKILALPSLSRMQVKTFVHESQLDKVAENMPATVKVDAHSEKSYKAKVDGVALMPTQEPNTSSDVKVYECVVTIDEEVRSLKPGMTATVQIHADRAEQVLCVPVQAVVETDNKRWCFVEGPQGLTRRPIELGRVGETLVEVRGGLLASERVVLNPHTFLDSQPGLPEEAPTAVAAPNHLAGNPAI